MASGGPPSGADLREAAESGDTARVTALLDGGVDVDSKDEEDGLTPLMYAARAGFTATVEALLSHKAGVDLQKKDGLTALHLAVSNCRVAVVAVLAAAEANVEIQDKNGQTPLMAAALIGHTPTLKALLVAGAGMDTKDNMGQTALMVAAASDHTTTVQSLEAAGADMNIQDGHGFTALMLALYKGAFKAAEVLIKAGAELYHQIKDSWTALIVQGFSRLIRPLQMLFAGWTALFFAAMTGRNPVVRLLLEKGADHTHKTKKGNTSFDIANQYGHCSVMEELEKYTARQLVVIPFKDLDFKETVGKGTFGVVRKGYWTSSDRGRQLVAIKQVDAVDEKEIEILGSLHHPNIIKLYGTSENKPYINLVTDFAEKGSLSDFISERLNSPDLKRALPLAKQVAEGMLYLHRRGIVHRDLKSSNVVLTSEWVAKICDLGAAREFDHTTMMTSVGTVAWMAPEMLKEGRASPKCDVYSYAIVLWELVSFQFPFKGLTIFRIMTKVTNGERPAIPSGCDQSLSRLIKQCWVQDYKERPPFEKIVRTLNSL